VQETHFLKLCVFYSRGTLSLQDTVPGCSVVVWRRKYFLIGGKTVKKSAAKKKKK